MNHFNYLLISLNLFGNLKFVLQIIIERCILGNIFISYIIINLLTQK